MIIGLASVVVLADLLHRRESAMSAIVWRPAAVAIGRRSYGLYRYHRPIFPFIGIGINTRPVILLLGFELSFAAAWTSFALIEQPFLRMKGRWSTTGRVGDTPVGDAGPV